MRTLALLPCLVLIGAAPPPPDARLLSIIAPVSGAQMRKLWRILRESFPEQPFRRQVPIRHHIADFASHRAKLVIEVDGGQHDPSLDVVCTEVIHQEGYRVLRFWNHEVLGNPEGVWSVIDRVLRDRHPTPTPPHQGEGL